MGTLRSTMSRRLSSVTRTSPSCSTLRRDHISGGSAMAKLMQSCRTTSVTAVAGGRMAGRQLSLFIPSSGRLDGRTQGRIDPGPDCLSRVRDGVARLDRLRLGPPDGRGRAEWLCRRGRAASSLGRGCHAASVSRASKNGVGVDRLGWRVDCSVGAVAGPPPTVASAAMPHSHHSRTTIPL